MSYPVLAFHGTKEINIHSICNTGFKVPGEENFEHATDTGKIISVLQQKKRLEPSCSKTSSFEHCSLCSLWPQDNQ